MISLGLVVMTFYWCVFLHIKSSSKVGPVFEQWGHLCWSSLIKSIKTWFYVKVRLGFRLGSG